MAVSQGPVEPREPRDVLETRAKADLRQAVWEVSQYMDIDAIERFVNDVLNEIESDQP